MTTEGAAATAPAARLSRVRHRTIDLVTPEGVPLSFKVALFGDRLLAFLLDFLIILGITFFFGLLAAVSRAQEMYSLVLVVNFLARNFYFMFFERRWQGSTPGKRSRRLRVIDAGGGLLSVQAVIVRNLTREIELTLPLVIIFLPEALLAGLPGYITLVAMLWMLVFGLLPLLNKQRRRVGDLIAGTVVIVSPQVALLDDLAAPGNTGGPADGPVYRFTEAQLQHYGNFELQVLEEFLRSPATGEHAEQAQLILGKIRAKIGWEDDVGRPEIFLREFYAAQRAYLENRMLLGRRRADKNAREE